MSYNNPVPVAVNVVTVQKKDGTIGLLGVERGIEPYIGGLAFPGGFVNQLESIEQAAAREFDEEVGIKSTPDDWRILLSRITPNNRVLVFCGYEETIAEDDVAKMVPNDEVKSFVILDPTSKLCFSLHQAVMDAAFDQIPRAFS